MTQSKHIVTSDKIIGVKVKNLADEKLGEIDKLVIDRENGQVCYAAVGIGGFLGIREKHIAVAWHALIYDTTQKCFILNADKSKLQSAKGIEEGWSDWANEAWAEDIKQQFSTQVPKKSNPKKLLQ